MIQKFCLGLVSLSFAAVLQASNTAQDNVSNNPPYNTGTGSWPNGSNGGFGFGPWSFSNSVTTNGFAGQFAGNVTGDGNGPGWGLFASDQNDSGNNGNSTATATRPFTGGGLLTGQTVSFTLGSTGSVYDGGQGGGAGIIGFNLLSGSTVEYTMKFTGGDTVWRLNDGGADFSSGIPFVGNAQIIFGFTYDGGNSYDVHITEGVNTYNCVGCVATSNVSNIDGVKFFDFGQGGGQNFAFNVLSVPEPSTWLAGAMALSGCFYLRLRRRKA
jgi:hypothetical protein